MLLNLHGSLSWLRDPRTGRLHKVVALGRLRDIDYWDHLKRGDALCQPLVVLTDQKEDVVVDPPFSVAYDAFGEQLVRADHWLIAGYGCRDRPVNVALSEAIAAKRRNATRRGAVPTLPRVLLIDKDCSIDAKKTEVAQLLDVPAGQIEVISTGFPAAVDDPLWADWAG